MIAGEKPEEEDDVCYALSVSGDDLFLSRSSVKKPRQGRGSVVQGLTAHLAVVCLQNSTRLRWEPPPTPVPFYPV